MISTQVSPFPVYDSQCVISASSRPAPFAEKDYRCQEFQHRIYNTLRQIASRGTRCFQVQLSTLSAIWCAEALVRLRLQIPGLVLRFLPGEICEGVEEKRVQRLLSCADSTQASPLPMGMETRLLLGAEADLTCSAAHTVRIPYMLAPSRGGALQHRTSLMTA